MEIIEARDILQRDVQIGDVIAYPVKNEIKFGWVLFIKSRHQVKVKSFNIGPWQLLDYYRNTGDYYKDAMATGKFYDGLVKLNESAIVNVGTDSAVILDRVDFDTLSWMREKAGV